MMRTLSRRTVQLMHPDKGFLSLSGHEAGAVPDLLFAALTGMPR